MSRLVLRSSAVAAGLTGLDWDGNPTDHRMLYWDGATVPSIPDLYPMAVLCKVYMRSNAGVVRNDGSKYGTIFFWGNNGNGTWQSSQNNTYWGIEPYPVPATLGAAGEWKFEIACYNRDYVTRVSGAEPFITNDRWYSLALVAQDGVACALAGGAAKAHHQAWLDLPSTATADRIISACQEQSPGNWGAEPPNRALFFGQSPYLPDIPSQSWGSYDNWDEGNCVIRGIQIYSAALTQTQVVALSAFDTDADVLVYCGAQSITPSLWYLNMNPTPTDVTDKSGNGHHGSWNDSTYRPGLWEG